VAQNAVVALGIVGAGTNNARLAGEYTRSHTQGHTLLVTHWYTRALPHSFNNPDYSVGSQLCTPAGVCNLA